MSKAAKIVAAICIACVAIQAIIWIGIAALSEQKKPVAGLAEAGGEE